MECKLINSPVCIKLLFNSSASSLIIDGIYTEAGKVFFTIIIISSLFFVSKNIFLYNMWDFLSISQPHEKSSIQEECEAQKRRSRETNRERVSNAHEKEHV